MQHTRKHTFTSFLSFVRSHDELPAFNAAYWVLTLLAAMLFNAGAFALLIMGHIVLDVYKYRDIHRKKWKKIVKGVLRENILDTALLSLGIAFAVYYNASLPILAGIRRLLRTEIALVNALIQITVKAHILHNMLMLLSHMHQYLHAVHPRLGSPASLLERVAGVSLIASVLFIAASPWILGFDAAYAMHLAADILIPWRM